MMLNRLKIPRPRTLFSIDEGLTISPLNAIQVASLHSSQTLNSKCAGRFGPSVKHDKPLTYEQANKPDQIGVRKSWNTFNTSAYAISGERAAECAHEDVLIRKFIHGTWPEMLASDIIIKRQANMIKLCFFIDRSLHPNKVYWLVGFSEEILSYLLKSIVKLDLQFLYKKQDLIYKYI